MIDRQVLGARMQVGGLYTLLLLLSLSKAAVEISFGVICIGWLLAHVGRDGWKRSIWSRRIARMPLLALTAYLIACLLSIPGSTSLDHSLHGFISKHLEYALFFVFAAEIGRHSKVVHRAILLLIIGAVLACLDAAVQQYTGYDLIRRYPLESYGRVTGPFENPNDMAAFLVVVIPITICAVCVRMGLLHNALCMALVTMLVCMAVTTSQGALLSLGVGLAFLGVQSPRLRRWMWGIMSVVAGVTMAMIYRIGDEISVGVRDRLYMWEAGWRMWLDRFWVGQGLNTFMSNYLRFWVGGEQAPRYAHNCYLQVAAETGLMGLVTLLTFLGVLVWRLLRGIRDMHDQRDRYYLIGISAAVLVFLAQAGGDTHFYSLRQAALFWTLAGMAFGLVAQQGMQET